MENLSLDKFSPTKAEITALADRYKSLTIDGLEDKAGYTAVDEGRKQLKKARVEIQKTRKIARQSALDYQKAVIKLEKELIDIIEPTELELAQKQKEIDELQKMENRKKFLPDRRARLEKIDV